MPENGDTFFRFEIVDWAGLYPLCLRGSTRLCTSRYREGEETLESRLWLFKCNEYLMDEDVESSQKI